MPQLPLTAKQIHIIVQAIRIAQEAGELSEFAKKGEIEALKNLLQNVKDV